MEYRVSIAESTAGNLNTRLDAQRKLATKARLCYQQAINAFTYGFSPAVGTNLYAADLFGERDTEDGNLFALFNLAVERWSSAFREEAAKQRARGISPQDQATAATQHRTALRDNAIQTHLLTAALADLASGDNGMDFTADGGPRLKTALDFMRQMGQAAAVGLNPLGYDDRFVPMKDFDQLLELANGYQNTAALSFDRFDSYRRDLDYDIVQLQAVLNEEATSAVKGQLASLTGVSQNASDFDARVAIAGDNFSDCGLDLDNAAFVVCMSAPDRATGTLAARYFDMHRARQQWLLATARKEGLLAEIERQVQQHGDRLEIEHINDRNIRDTLRNFLDDMANARTVVKSEQKYKDDVKRGDSSDSKGKRTTTTTSWYVKNDDLGLQVEKEIDMQAHLKDYRVTLDGIQHLGTIESLKQQVIEQDIAIGLEIQNENAAALAFANLLAERDNLMYRSAQATTHSRWLTKRIMARAAEARMLRSRAALRFQSDLNIAIRFSYLAAKALEYKYLQPLVDLPIGDPGTLLNLSDLYKMQDAEDLKRFNQKLAGYDTCPWGSIQFAYVKISLAWDVLGLTDAEIDRRDPSCASLQSWEQQSCRIAARKREWQAFVNQNLSPDAQTGRQVLRIAFSTSLEDRMLAFLGRYNLKAWYGNAPDPCDPVPTKGFAINFDTTQAGTNWSPSVTIEQRGAMTLLRPDNTVVEYVPVTEYLNMAGKGSTTDEMFRTRFVLSDPRSGLFIGIDPDLSLSWNNGLKGRSIAAANWTIEVKDVGRQPVQWDKVDDVVLHIDALGWAQ